MATGSWLAIIGSSTNEIIEAPRVFRRPSDWIVLPVQDACGHEGVMVRSNGVKAVVDRKVGKTNSVLYECFMEFQCDMGTCCIVANGHGTDVKAAEELIETRRLLSGILLLILTGFAPRPIGVAAS